MNDLKKIQIRIGTFLRMIKDVRKDVRRLKERIASIEEIILNMPEFEQTKTRMKKKAFEHEERLKKIVSIYCKKMELNYDFVMHSKSRLRKFAEKRQFAQYLAKKYTDLSLQNIGDMIGGKKHCTVLHSDKAIKDRLTYDKAFNIMVDSICNEIEVKLNLVLVLDRWVVKEPETIHTI